MSNKDELEELKALVSFERKERREELRLRGRMWRMENLPYVRKKQVLYRRRRREKMIALKGGKCADCGGVFPPYAYDFHHIDGRDHSMPRIAAMKWKDALEELDKCVLLCAVCHRGRHVISDEDMEIAEQEIDTDDDIPY